MRVPPFSRTTRDGTDGCAGTPKVCQPVWTATFADFVRAPTVANGVVYVTSNNGELRAYDASGASCEGLPKVCEPLWTASTGDSIFAGASVKAGVAYVATVGGHLFAYDANGATNCAAGTPKVCQPLWSAGAGLYLTVGGPAVANHTVYFGSFDGDVYAFDARGITNCSGVSNVCAPLWTANLGYRIVAAPTVTGNTLYITAPNHTLYAFDANGEGCSGSPKTCSPLWSGRIAPEGTPDCSGRCFFGLSPFVSNGLVFTGSDDGLVYAFDADGAVGCTGSPTTCAPVWTTSGGGDPIIANGRLYVSDGDLRTHVYEVPGSQP